MSETAPAIERLGIRKYHHGNEALHGVVRPGKFTVYPQAIALGATFHPAKLEEMADTISDEARARHNAHQGEMLPVGSRYSGLLTFWSPNLNVARDPRWGRTGETYGEDPYLIGACGTAFVKGLQGEKDGHIKAVATPKHFVANNEEHNRFECKAEIPRDQYFDYYLKPFEAAVKEGNCAGIMAAYNAVNGIPCHANHELLTDILRGRWGFQGYVVSDCGAISNIWDPHKYVERPDEAAAAAVNAGVDLECGSCGKINQVFLNHLKKALDEGLVTEKEINRAVFNILTAREKVGFLDEEIHTFDELTEEIIGCEKHHELALRLAEESLVLLKNDNYGDEPILPIKKKRKICILGMQADRCQFGDYSGQPVHEPISILKGMKEEFPEDQLVYVPYEVNAVDDNYRILGKEYLYHEEAGALVPGMVGSYDTFDDGRIENRVDEQIDFNWERMAPDPLLQKKQFKIVWNGCLVPTVSGTYKFLVKVNEEECRCKGSYKLYVDGKQALLDNIYLEAGKVYKLSLEYKNMGVQPAVRLFWKMKDWVPSKRFSKEKEMAKECDIVLACVGLGLEYESEGKDKFDLDLPKEQQEMLEAVAEVNPNLVVTLYNGSSLTIPWLAEHAAAILECWYPGEQGGRAIARVLSGKVNPSGKLPLTFYKDVADLPSFQCYDLTQGLTYWYAKDVLYPFGYGLSYTEYKYSDMTAESDTEQIRGSVSVSNIGNMAGYGVVQIYVKYLEDESAPRKLMFVDKIWLEPGETKKVPYQISNLYLETYQADTDLCAISEGRYELAVGLHAQEMVQKITLRREENLYIDKPNYT